MRISYLNGRRRGIRPLFATTVLAMLVLSGGAVSATAAAELNVEAAERFVGQDTLVAEAEPGSDAAAMLGQFSWDAGAFEVQLIREPAEVMSLEGVLATDADALATFPSPLPRDDADAAVNTVVLEWFAAEGAEAEAARPAVLVLDILDGRMRVARAFARTLAQQGIEAFAMHMPSHGWRQIDRFTFDGEVFFELCVQAVADARRARDAIGALPNIDTERISIQGTSLGGFIASAAASVDPVFDNAFIMLAGGNLYDMLHDGRREAAMIRRLMARSGFEGERLRELCERIEPTRLAHRLDPAKTWLISANGDQVVPAPNAQALADAASLDEANHFWLAGDHYSVLLHMPWAVRMIAETILSPASIE